MAENWKDALPEGMRDAPFIKGADTMESAVEQITNAASHMGNSIRIPSENASNEDMQNFYIKLSEKAPGVMVKPDLENDQAMKSFYKSIGQPDKPEDYKFQFAEDAIPPDLNGFNKIAFDQGLSQKQYEGMMTAVMAGVVETQSLSTAEMKDAMTSLATEWGMTFENRMMMVKNFLKMSDAPEGLDALLSSGEMAPDEIKWMYAMATKMKSPTELAEFKQEQPGEVISTVEAKNRISEMLNNRDHPYWKPADPRNKDAIRTMLKLQQMANPEASTSIDDLRI